MEIILSSKVTSKLFSWAHSPGEFKNQFSSRLRNLFDRISRLSRFEDENDGWYNFRGDYYEPAIKFHKYRNVIAVYDFDVYDSHLQAKETAYPAIIEKRFFQNIKSAHVIDEKSLYAIGELAVTPNYRSHMQYFPGTNSLGIHYDYLACEETTILLLLQLISSNSQNVHGIAKDLKSKYQKIYRVFQGIEDDNSELHFSPKLDIVLNNQIPWLSPEDPELQSLDDSTFIRLLELEKCTSLDERIEEFERINLNKSFKGKIENRLLEYETLKNQEVRTPFSHSVLDEIPETEIVATTYLSNIKESLKFWEKLIKNREDQKKIYSLQENNFIKVFAGPATGKTQLMIIRALNILRNAIEKGQNKHLLFITFNNDQSEDIKQRLRNLGCEDFLINHMGERIQLAFDEDKREIHPDSRKKQTLEVYSLYEWCRDFVKIALEGSIADLTPFEKFKNTREALEERKNILRGIIKENNKKKRQRYSEEQNETLVTHCVSSITRYIIPRNIQYKNKFIEEAPYRSERYRGLIWYLYEQYRTYLEENSKMDPEMFVMRAESLWKDVSFKGLREVIEYDSLFIDEVQDLLNHQRRMAGQLLKKISKSIMIVGDPNQSVYHTTVYIRNPGDWKMKEFGLSIQLRYTRAIANFLQEFQNHNVTLEIAEDLPLYDAEKKNVHILPDIGPSPIFEKIEYKDLVCAISAKVRSYLSFGTPEDNKQLLPSDILIIILPDKKANIVEEETWEEFVNKLKKELRQNNIRSIIFDGAGNIALAHAINIVWGQKMRREKRSLLLLFLGLKKAIKKHIYLF